MEGYFDVTADLSPLAYAGLHPAGTHRERVAIGARIHRVRIRHSRRDPRPVL
jgi:hypothetical protein